MGYGFPDAYITVRIFILIVYMLKYEMSVKCISYYWSNKTQTWMDIYKWALDCARILQIWNNKERHCSNTERGRRKVKKPSSLFVSGKNWRKHSAKHSTFLQPNVICYHRHWEFLKKLFRFVCKVKGFGNLHCKFKRSVLKVHGAANQKFHLFWLPQPVS